MPTFFSDNEDDDEGDDVKAEGFLHLLKRLKTDLKQLKKSSVLLTQLHRAAWEGDAATALELIEKSTPQELVMAGSNKLSFERT